MFHRVSDERVVDAPGKADIPNNDRAGVQPDPQARKLAAHSASLLGPGDVCGGPAGTGGVVRLWDRVHPRNTRGRHLCICR